MPESSRILRMASWMLDSQRGANELRGHSRLSLNLEGLPRQFQLWPQEVRAAQCTKHHQPLNLNSCWSSPKGLENIKVELFWNCSMLHSGVKLWKEFKRDKLRSKVTTPMGSRLYRWTRIWMKLARNKNGLAYTSTRPSETSTRNRYQRLTHFNMFFKVVKVGQQSERKMGYKSQVPLERTFRCH